MFLQVPMQVPWVCASHGRAFEHVSQRNGSRLPHHNPRSGCMALMKYSFLSQMVLLTLLKKFVSIQRKKGAIN